MEAGLKSAIPGAVRTVEVGSEGSEGGVILMLITRRGLEPLAVRALRAIANIMTPASELFTVSPQDTADEALRLLGSHDIDQLPVLDGRELAGLLRRQDILRWLSLHLEGVRAEE
jgi:CBS domain-containing protein